MPKADSQQIDALRVVLAGDEPDRAEFRAALVQHDGLAIAEAGFQEPREGPAPDVLMIAFGTDPAPALQYLKASSRTENHPIHFALLKDRSVAPMQRALRSGADEVLFLPLDPVDTARALLKALKASEAHRRGSKQTGGQVCAIASLTGGVGVTSLAGNLALALFRMGRGKVVLVDLDLQGADLSVVFSLQPERTIADVASSDNHIDSIALEPMLGKHSSGVYLLAAPRRIEEGERVVPAGLGRVIELMQEMFDFVVVDCGPIINENAVAVWERAEHLFYLIEQSVPSMRSALRFVDLFNRLHLAGPEPSFVLSRYSAGQPIGEQQIAETLSRPLFARIPRDDKSLELAMARSQDIWEVAPNSVMCRAVEELASLIAVGKSAAPETSKTGFLAKLSRLFPGPAAA